MSELMQGPRSRGWCGRSTSRGCCGRSDGVVGRCIDAAVPALDV